MARPAFLRTFVAVVLVTTLVVAGVNACRTPAPQSSAAKGEPDANAPGEDGSRGVFVVGNNWDGTADVFDARTFERIVRINVVPDKTARIKERSNFLRHPKTSAMFFLVFFLIGERHFQLIDDMFLSNDGRFLFASRPSFADAIKIDLVSGKMDRIDICQQRSDHAALSPDGKTFLVSCTFEGIVQSIDTASFKVVSSFKTEKQAHESNYFNESLVYHANIGNVSPKVAPTSGNLSAWRKEISGLASAFSANQLANFSEDLGLVFQEDKPDAFGTLRKDVEERIKGPRLMHVVQVSRDAQGREQYAVKQRIDMGEKVNGFVGPDGRPYTAVDKAIRPMAIVKAPGRAVPESIFLQVSFFHGFFEYGPGENLNDPKDTAGKIKRAYHLPVSDKVNAFLARDFQLNSAHHGIAVNHDGTKICVAGTISGYAAIIDRATGHYRLYSLLDTDERRKQTPLAELLESDPKGAKPYWATESLDGKFCYLSISEQDRVVAIPFDDADPADLAALGFGEGDRIRYLDQTDDSVIQHYAHKIGGEEKVGVAKSLAVGDHPQRIRNGRLSAEAIQALSSKPNGVFVPSVATH